ncbi:uncharacterized protein LOC111630978 [Centruroides sculpturatus]|uniref:uncharacterized protein LOC111630978 n=1 Tax=Centruroides sculpturatus TaxID=218467 RepID=UPI000C6D04F5|nr:uncharacterized protein LOC111630978 [Centruroides sculpturatus]XP_023230920.1 uncharacterized protein LOC111630978 [Centruroides sculpturatus]XP_023230921.1 uncharacterized protein LOC111630978 [Centruroides sculpturatus]
MADSGAQQALMVNGEVGLAEDISALVTSQTTVTEVSTADILQQALEQASGELNQVAVTYDNVENAVAVIHGELPADSGAVIVTENKQIEPDNQMEMVHLPDSQLIDSTEAQNIPVYQTENSADITNEVDSSTNVIPDTEMVAVSSTGENPNTDLCNISNTEELDVTDQALADSVNLEDVSVSPQTGVDLSHLTLPPKSTSAPLGSSANPIQIIQQGNTYHSTQVLTQDQLQQIAHVLQQQQVSKALNNGGKAVLYNPATNTRIIYRVIYPSELNKTSDSERDHDGSFQRGGPSSRGRGRPRKGWGKKNEEDENKTEGPELSREEKEKRKKHRPRTRSGRISKPPAYMMRDYKRIHHLDFDEEPYDDSDGGYSDYQVSDEDGEKRSYKACHLPPGVTTAKPRNYKCRYCDKAYIGRGGLARHFRLNPSHGNIIDIEDGSTQDENSNSSMASAVGSTTMSSGHQMNFGRHGSTRGDDDHHHPRSYNSEIASARRKAKLKDFLNHCQEEELMEVVMPHLSQNITLWEFLLMKTESSNPSQPHIPAILDHFDSLLKHIQKVAKTCLAPTSPDRKDDKFCYQVHSEDLARSLNLQIGVYEVKQFAEKASFGMKRPAPDVENMKTGEEANQIADQMNPSKKQCMDETVGEALSSTLSDQILNESVDNIDLSGLRGSLVSEMGNNQRNALLHQQVTDESVLNSFDLSGDNYNVEGKLTSTSQNAMVTSSVGTVSKSQMQGISQQPTLQVRKVQIFGSSKIDETNENHEVLEGSIGSSHGTTEDSSNMLVNNRENISVITSDGSLSTVVNVQGTATTLNEYSSVTGLMTGEGILLNNSSVPPGTNVVISVPDSTMSGQHNAMETEDSSTCAEVNSSDMSVVNTVEANNEMTEANSKILPEGNQITSEGKKVSEMNQVVCAESADDGTAVIRQLVLPDGQVIGTWSMCGQVEGVTELGDQLSQNYMPNNVVIVQNPDGTTTLQVPSDQSIPLETLQALLAMDPTIIGSAQENEIEKTQVDGKSQ